MERVKLMFMRIEVGVRDMDMHAQNSRDKRGAECDLGEEQGQPQRWE